MSPVDLKCVDCGSSNIIEDDLHGQVQVVCEDCGSVVSQDTLVTDSGQGSVDVSYSFTTQKSKTPCPNLKKGLQQVKALCRVLRVNSDIERSSQMFFGEAYNHERFLNVSLTKKRVLAGCCVLISCRMNNCPVTMGTIVYLTDSDPETVGPVYQDALKVLNVHVPALNISEVMKAHCQEYRLTSERVGEELAADSLELTKRALALVELAADAWIVTGRRPVPIMRAATFLAWQSLRPTKLRRKTTLGRFCRLAEVDAVPPAAKRVSEIKAALCKLAGAVPWEKREVSPDNVVLQVEDILNYRFALLRRALKDHEDSMKDDTQPSDDTEVTDSSPAQTEPSLSSERCDGADWGKPELFLPPCVLKPKKRKRGHSSQREVTGDEEISDSEISSYIRTPQEVQDFIQTQNLLHKSHTV